MICQPLDRLYRLLPVEHNSENFAKLHQAAEIPNLICRTEFFLILSFRTVLISTNMDCHNLIFFKSLFSFHVNPASGFYKQ